MIEDIFKQAQGAFNTWSKWEPQDRTTSRLLKMLDFDFFEVLDSVTSQDPENILKSIMIHRILEHSRREIFRYQRDLDLQTLILLLTIMKSSSSLVCCSYVFIHQRYLFCHQSLKSI